MTLTNKVLSDNNFLFLYLYFAQKYDIGWNFFYAQEQQLFHHGILKFNMFFAEKELFGTK